MIMDKIRVHDGKSYPLGSVYDGKGVNFALFSKNAEKVELCLFDEFGVKEVGRIAILSNDNNIWHIYIENLQPGQVYGYRVYGPYKPQEGKRFNPNKLLLDPYAKKVVGKLIWHKALFGYDTDSPEGDLSFSKLDSAPYVPKAVVVENTFDWENDKKPSVPYENTVIYETHVRGYTMLHPQVENSHRGKFLGMASNAVMSYLDYLGITTIELLPVFAFYGNKDGMYTDNYWGYETLSYFVPEAKYLTNNNIDDFKQMVKTFHRHNKEVILDVVYNHTIEGNEKGPTLCYRGIDNESYYILQDNRRFYVDTTGCGASFNIQNPYVLTLVMDSLRYWAEEMHVDGFRLDLASSMGRVNNKFSMESGFLMSARQDDTLRQVKMIVEPWDATIGGYKIGAYPPGWAEWNDRYRDVIRRFWRGDTKQVGEFASRITGSSDIFRYNNRDIWSSINFITAHDGFTLKDLVCYNDKHNDINGENNNDGNSANWSWNSGTEGESDNPTVLMNRQQRMRAMLATLLLSFGTPMLVAGDEFGNTQFGNNNPYCQDNVYTWLVWEAIDNDDAKLQKYVHKLIKLRHKLNIYQRRDFFDGNIWNYAGKKVKDLMWLTESGKEFSIQDWTDEGRKSISCLIFDGTDSYWLIFNSHSQPETWYVPEFIGKQKRELLLDSSEILKPTDYANKNNIEIPAWCVLLFKVSKAEE